MLIGLLKFFPAGRSNKLLYLDLDGLTKLKRVGMDEMKYTELK